MRRLFTVTVLALLVCASAAGPVAAKDDGGGGSRAGLAGEGPKAEKAYEKTINLAVDDIRSFWADEFPVLYPDLPYEEVADDEIFPMTPDTTHVPSCGGNELSYSDVEGNAQYARCNTGEKLIWWDDEELFPQLFRDYGEFSIALVLAHEWGHAIQDQAGNLGDENRSIDKERQADCFAGAWTQRVQNGDSTVSLKGGDLDSALSALLQVRDDVGSDAEAEGAHGSGFDRVTSFQEGLAGGAPACADYFVNPRISTEIPFSDEQEAASGGNLGFKATITASVDLLNDFYGQVASDVYKALDRSDVHPYDSSAKKSDLPTCGGTTPARKDITNRIFYCLDDGYIGFDKPYLKTVHDTIGDFGVATLFANAWATYVQTLQDFPGVSDNTDNAVLGADCYTGGFTAAIYNNVLLVDPDTQEPAYRLSPGDLDETIQAFIDYNKARGVEANLDVTFLRVQTFKDGFLNGYGSCSKWSQDTSTTLDEPSG